MLPPSGEVAGNFVFEPRQILYIRKKTLKMAQSKYYLLKLSSQFNICTSDLLRIYTMTVLFNIQPDILTVMEDRSSVLSEFV